MTSSIDYGCLAVGIHVDIQRTDGRIHQAVVTGLAPETSSVTVEWYEKGETKGKEVELEMIQLLNPELFNNIANNGNGVETAASNGVPSPVDEAPPAASPVEPTPKPQPREIPKPSGPGVFKAPAPRGFVLYLISFGQRSGKHVCECDCLFIVLFITRLAS